MKQIIAQVSFNVSPTWKSRDAECVVLCALEQNPFCWIIFLQEQQELKVEREQRPQASTNQTSGPSDPFLFFCSRLILERAINPPSMSTVGNPAGSKIQNIQLLVLRFFL